MFHSSKGRSDYQGYRAAAAPDRSANTLPTLVGAGMIAASILLATLVHALGTRYSGIEGQTEQNVWLIDRLTGNVYKCQAIEHGKAACDGETLTGSISGPPRR